MSTNRQKILGRFREKIAIDQPIIVVEPERASVQSAKEAGGIDLIVVYNVRM